jgi:glucokinase
VRNKPDPISIAACVDIGGTKALLGLIDRQGNILAREMFYVNAEYQPATLAVELADRMRSLADQYNLDWKRVCGVGYSTTGMMDVENGIIFTSPNQGGWRDINYGHILEDSFKLPARIEMDANAAALGESWLGVGKKNNPFILLIVGTGIGAGILIDGNILRGWRGTAGEIGHMCIHPDGPPCNCGGRGCLESLASGPAITLQARQLLNEGRVSSLMKPFQSNLLTTPIIFDAARQKDPLALEVIEYCVDALSIGMTNIIHLLNPKMIAIGGGVGLGGADLLLEPIRLAISRRVGPWVDFAGTHIVPAQLGNDAGLYGAAWLVWNHIDQVKIFN